MANLKTIFFILLICVNIFNVFSLDNPELLKLYNEAKEILSDKTFILNNHYSIINNFGFFKNPFYDEIYFCESIFISTQSNSEIFSITDGEIIETGFAEGTGNFVKIIYNDFEIIYGCLSFFEKNVGDKILRGQVIGYAGRHTGHLGSGIVIKIKYKNVFLNPYFILNYDNNQD
jgi:murein DD-endopeptidase MepM/ murein hydrolase activator NlpD